MKKLLLLLPLLLTLPASAQTLSKESTGRYVNQILQLHKNFSRAGEAENWPMVCAALRDQAAILNTTMTNLQFHFPETDWMALSNANAKSRRDLCKYGGALF